MDPVRHLVRSRYRRQWLWLVPALALAVTAGCDGSVRDGGPLQPGLADSGVQVGDGGPGAADAGPGPSSGDAGAGEDEGGGPGPSGRDGGSTDVTAPDPDALVPGDVPSGPGDDGPGADTTTPPPAQPDPCDGAFAACAASSVSGFSEGEGLHPLDRCSFGLGGASLHGSDAVLDALAARTTPVTLARVVGDGNRSATRITSLSHVTGLKQGFTWQSGDTTVAYWIPQAITGSGDGTSSGLIGDRRVLLVGWYFDPEESPDDPRERGVRISFVDITDPAAVKYRHALLVVPSGTAEAPDYGPVNVHAGGMAWFGRYLYVADTGAGFRVFDLERILQISSGDSLGHDAASNTFNAFGYKYVVPQVGRYRLHADSCTARFSFVALDRSSSPPSLVSGEYISDSIYGKLHRWPLVEATGELLTTEGVIRPEEAFFSGQTRVQGAVSRDGNFWLSSSSQNGTRFGGLYRARGGASSAEYSWPAGPEDLYLDPSSSSLWSLTEHAPDRHVFSVGLSTVSP